MNQAVENLVNPVLRQRLDSLREDSKIKLMKHPAVQAMLEGKPLLDVYMRYLLNVYHYARHSAVVIGMAGARAIHRSPAVGTYLLHHATEEVGHECWAQSDLESLGMSPDAIRESRPSYSCSAMIATEYYWAAHDNPVGLIGWMYTLEGFGDDIGHLVASIMDKQILQGHGGTYFLHGHGDADHNHIRDITKLILEDVVETDLDSIFHVADLSCRQYLGMLSEAAGLTAKIGADQ